MTRGGGFSALLIDGVLLLGTSNHTPSPPFAFMTLVTPLTSPEPLDVCFYQMGIVSVPGLTQHVSSLSVPVTDFSSPQSLLPFHVRKLVFYVLGRFYKSRPLVTSSIFKIIWEMPHLRSPGLTVKYSVHP